MPAHDGRAGEVVITGATGMLGSATATQLARKGIDTVLVARDASRGGRLVQALNRTGGAHRLVIGDLSEPESVRATADTIRSGHEHVAGLVAKPATPPTASLDTTSQRLLWTDSAALLGIDVAATIRGGR